MGAILGLGASRHNAHMNNYAHIQLLKRYTEIRNRKFTPLFLTSLTDEDEYPKLNVTKKCEAAFREAYEETVKKAGELFKKLFETFETCQDELTAACNQTFEEIAKFEKHNKSM